MSHHFIALVITLTCCYYYYNISNIMLMLIYFTCHCQYSSVVTWKHFTWAFQHYLDFFWLFYSYLWYFTQWSFPVQYIKHQRTWSGLFMKPAALFEEKSGCSMAVLHLLLKSNLTDNFFFPYRINWSVMVSGGQRLFPQKKKSTFWKHQTWIFYWKCSYLFRNSSKKSCR